MNCFQKLLSSWHDTTKFGLCCLYERLWIAFKNYYLRDTTQLLWSVLCQYYGCELLSKIIIFVTRHNKDCKWTDCREVVNCFQKLLSSWHDTTLLLEFHSGILLWIAFKNYYLRDTTQHNQENGRADVGCELLSKIIIFVTRHNRISNYNNTQTVVNCFQKLLSSWHDTTGSKLMNIDRQLWIAFKNYYLRDTTQQTWFGCAWSICCELLSKIIIFVTRHNHLTCIKVVLSVVNCFQKLLSSWHDTTRVKWFNSNIKLWIAFKNYYLRDTTQHWKYK